MQLSELTAISPVDGRYFSKTSPLAEYFSEYALIKARVTVEIRWLQHLANQPDIAEFPKLSDTTHKHLDSLIDKFSVEEAQVVKDIEKTTQHDVKAVEYYLKEKLCGIPELHQNCEFIHFACTSEDINNVSYALLLKQASEKVLLPAYQDICTQLAKLAHQHHDLAMLSRTHGQAASPTTFGKEMANFFARLDRQLTLLKNASYLAKMNGAVGNYNAHVVAYPSVDWLTLSQTFIQQLGLDWNAYTTQIEPHDYIAEIFHNMIRINQILLDCARDCWGYISLDYLQLKKVENEIGSSTMPHKINPIHFENAEGNALFANSLAEHMASTLTTSRWQRDLTDSTLLRNLGMAYAHTLITVKSLNTGLSRISPNKKAMQDDLDQQWAILAEALQTVMRKHKIEHSYELLKTLTRGEKVDKAKLHQFILTLDLPSDVKNELYALTPENYTGLAAILADAIND